MTRAEFIERTLRQVYGGYVTEDSSITPMLVNSWLNDAIALAAKTNYTDAVKLDGIGYVNNAFYTTFKGLTATKDEKSLWKITLPQVPVGVGVNEGISTLQFKDENGNLSLPCIPISENQKTYFQSLANLPNKTIYYNEGTYVYVISNLKLSDYTASVTMVSGGDSSDLNAVLSIPSDYMPVIVQYVQQQLIIQKSRPQDVANDGADITMN
jgi:hypothetical protein